MAKNPDVVQTRHGFKRKGATGQPTDNQYEDNNEFFRCYRLVQDMTVESLQRQLWKIGWPYERIVIRALGWEEAVRRLKDDAKAMLVMVRMCVAIEDPDGRLYLVRTPDIVSGINGVHKNLKEITVQSAMDTSLN